MCLRDSDKIEPPLAKNVKDLDIKTALSIVLVLTSVLVIFAVVSGEPFDVNGTTFTVTGTTSVSSISFPQVFVPVVGPIGAILPMFIVMFCVGILLSFIPKGRDLSETAFRFQSLTLPVILVTVSTAIVLILNIDQWSVHSWIMYGWDTPQYLWQPLQYTWFNIEHLVFPTNHFLFSPSGSPSIMDEPPGLLLLLNVIYHVFGDTISVFEVVQLSMLILIVGSLFILTRMISSSMLVSALATSFLSIGLGFYILEWGSFDNLFCLIFLNFGLAAVLAKGRWFWISPFLLLVAIFSEDSGIIFVSTITIFLIASNIRRLRAILRILVPFITSIVVAIPYELSLFHTRGSFSLTSISQSISTLSYSDFLRSTGGIIVLGLAGSILAFKLSKEKFGYQLLLGYLTAAFVLSLPYFFLYPFRFLWMLQIPLSICVAIFVASIKPARVLYLAVTLVLVSQAVFVVGMLSQTNQYAAQNSYGFPGTYLNQKDLSALQWLASRANSSYVIVTPSQYGNWIIAYTHAVIVPQDQYGYDQLTPSQWVKILNSQDHHVIVFASSNYPSFFQDSQPCFNNSWDYVWCNA